MKLMTNERMAEIEGMRMRSNPYVKGSAVLPASSELTEELFQALKAAHTLIAKLKEKTNE